MATTLFLKIWIVFSFSSDFIQFFQLYLAIKASFFKSFTVQLQLYMNFYVVFFVTIFLIDFFKLKMHWMHTFKCNHYLLPLIVYCKNKIRLSPISATALFKKVNWWITYKICSHRKWWKHLITNSTTFVSAIVQTKITCMVDYMFPF